MSPVGLPLPIPLKWPTPATRHSAPIWPTVDSATRFAPFSDQSCSAPVLLSHSTAERPVPKKSPVATGFHSTPIRPFERLQFTRFRPSIFHPLTCPPPPPLSPSPNIPQS